MKRRLAFVVESGTDVRLVEGLAERFDLRVVARRIPGGVSVSQPPQREVHLVAGPAGRLAFARFAGRTLRGMTPRPDIVLVQGYGLAALAVNRVARTMPVTTRMLVCSPVETYYRCRRGRTYAGKPYRWWELAGLTFLARVNARIAGGYIVLSTHLAEVVAGHGTGAPIDIVPVYGVDTDHFTPNHDDRTALRRRLNLPAQGALLFFSSRVAPEKDAETLLEAVRQLRARGDDIWILHRSGAHELFVATAHRYGVRDRVVASDARHPHDGLRDDYRAADLCIQASRAEGLGFSPLEALACGTPVIASAVGGLQETIVPGETGWTYPVGDAAALAATITEALADPDEGRRRAMRGRALVTERFARGKAFDRLEEVLG